MMVMGVATTVGSCHLPCKSHDSPGGGTPARGVLDAACSGFAATWKAMGCDPVGVVCAASET